MKNKKTYIEAIGVSDLYNSSEKKILQELIKISNDNVAIISAKYLVNVTGISTTVVYVSLKQLQQHGIINKLPQRNSYELNQQKLDHIAKIYNNKNSNTI